MPDRCRHLHICANICEDVHHQEDTDRRLWVSLPIVLASPLTVNLADILMQTRSSLPGLHSQHSSEWQSLQEMLDKGDIYGMYPSQKRSASLWYSVPQHLLNPRSLTPGASSKVYTKPFTALSCSQPNSVSSCKCFGSSTASRRIPSTGPSSS